MESNKGFFRCSHVEQFCLHPSDLLYRRDEILPSYIGIIIYYDIISHFQDPYFIQAGFDGMS